MNNQCIEINRKTKETDISLRLSLEGKGVFQGDTGIGFFNHMLEVFTKQSRMDLWVQCQGDLNVDAHHTVEDMGIVLGMAIDRAMQGMTGFTRYGFCILPMDEALILTAIDLSGRSLLRYDMQLTAEKVGVFDTELVQEFFYGFVRHARATVHIKQLAGENTHHIIEGIFKSFGRSLRQAVSPDPAMQGEIPSTKGVL